MLSHQLVELPCLYLDDGPETEALGVDLDQAAKDFAVFQVPFPCELEYVGGTITEACAGTQKPICKFDKRPTAGSDTNRGDGDAGTLDLGTTEAGKFAYDDAKAGLALEPGEEIVFELTQRAETTASGHIRPTVVVRYTPEVWGNLDNAVCVTPSA